ncbi:tellurite resistance/C4-dicarboxylate transporter family protein [Streptomyces sp. NPDC059582]|uniref:tellurite resistance/C4-dicarboxylate transporter family protein n=1 Tax=Streptomyces sp. NPDC059582 TaxID=3346875 RepID=UPI0036A7D68A
MPRTSPLRAWWAHGRPAAGAAVLATGILSVALQLTGYEVLSRTALVLACAAWLALAAGFAVQLLWARENWVSCACTPAALTSVAATAVLGTRFSVLGRQTLAEALLALAAVLWPVLLVVVLRHWERRMPGAVFLGCVATQGLAVLCATLAGALSTAWLAHAALVLFLCGLVLYCLGLAHFDLRQAVEGAGDQWVAGGALSISALAGARLLAADGPRLYLWNDDDRGALRVMTVGLLALDVCWYVVLLAAELLRPRLGYDVLRWSTAFPMGMTATAALSVASAVGVPWLKAVGEVLLWIAVAVWLAVAVAAVRAASGAVRAGVTSTAPR